jgi:hypothetical protein
MSIHADPRAAVFAGAGTETAPDRLAPEVEVGAQVWADEVRALERPRTRMYVTGKRVRKDDFARRDNLPRRLEPGRAYRDAYVHRRMAGRLANSAEGG